LSGKGDPPPAFRRIALGYHGGVTRRTLVIVNPSSRGGATGRRWGAVQRRLEAALGTLEVEWTRGPRDAERIAREGVRAGVERLVVAGGDGTLGEVVTGLLGAGLGSYAEIGLLPLGTGGDFVRTPGIPRDLEGAIAALVAGKARRVDAGRLGFLDRSGREATLGFVNAASLGVSGLVVELVNRAPKALGGRFSFLIGTLRALARYRCQPVTLRLDGDCVFEGPLVLAAAANGRCFGGGMRVAPQACLDDGLLDLVVVPELPRLRLLAELPRLYRGTHLQGPPAQLHRGRVLEAEAAAGSVWIEVDGEPVGTLPARVEILPGALSLIGPAS
jgi:YegS/Rv2252/BmrU family lipid kinase